MAESTCSIDGCGKPHVARSYCGTHYRRWRLNGDPQVVRHWWPDEPTCSIDGCEGVHLARGLCGTHYARWRRHGDTDKASTHPYRGTDREAFDRNVDRTGDCWMWTGPVNSAGYGSIRVGGRRVGAHVAALLLDGQEVPAGMQVDHLCFVRRCVRLDHLEIVTQQENLRRARERGET